MIYFLKGDKRDISHTENFWFFVWDFFLFVPYRPELWGSGRRVTGENPVKSVDFTGFCVLNGDLSIIREVFTGVCDTRKWLKHIGDDELCV